MSPYILYRGDYARIEEFQFSKTNRQCLLGQGVYLTTDAQVADTYRTKGSNVPSVSLTNNLVQGVYANWQEAWQAAYLSYLLYRKGRDNSRYLGTDLLFRLNQSGNDPKRWPEFRGNLNQLLQYQEDWENLRIDRELNFEWSDRRDVNPYKEWVPVNERPRRFTIRLKTKPVTLPGWVSKFSFDSRFLFANTVDVHRYHIFDDHPVTPLLVEASGLSRECLRQLFCSRSSQVRYSQYSLIDVCQTVSSQIKDRPRWYYSHIKLSDSQIKSVVKDLRIEEADQQILLKLLPTFVSKAFWAWLRQVLIPYGIIGYRYDGGVTTGNKRHQAFVLWDEDYVNAHRVKTSK